MISKSEFKPKRGQVDFTGARWAPVINCAVKYGNKILLIKRSKSLNFYPGYWNGVSGFLDDQRSIEEKVKDELKEEIGIGKENIIKIQLGQIFDQEEPKYKKTWIVHPILVEVKTDKVKLDWEAESYQWVKPEEAKNFKLLPGFDKVLENLPIFNKNNF